MACREVDVKRKAEKRSQKLDSISAGEHGGQHEESVLMGYGEGSGGRLMTELEQIVSMD